MTTQKYREVEIETPLGTDVLLLKEATITEALSQPFIIELQLLSRQEDIHFEDLLGENATLRIELPEGQTRYFNGNFSDFSQTGNAGDFAVYHATLRPWLWFLTQTSDCRIYQNKTVPDIIKDIFRERGFSDFEERLSREYHEWSYCVLYRESYFDFVNRLLEQEGIYYYFEHDNGKHTLVLADSYSSHDLIPGHETLPYHSPNIATVRDEQHVSQWRVAKKIHPGRIVLDDFDFERPKADLSAHSSIPGNHGQSDYETYDYPGEYRQIDHGESYARTRMEALHSQYEIIRATSDVRALQAGILFKLDLHPREDQNREYLIVSVTHTIQSDAYRSAAQSSGPTCTNIFTAMDSATPYRPLQRTSKPKVQGPQTAIVVGPLGEEIYTDEYGRVKLQFHWDRYGQADENASCWIRVSQLWAGKGWGGMTIPRIGQEVIVEFLEGDPDQPIVTGRVYNGDHRTPYKLPQFATRSGIKSQSSKGGGGFNEIRFEDKKGEEQVFLHAERNQDVRIKKDSLEWIGHDRHRIVKNDQFERIEGNSHLTLQGDQNVKINGNTSLDIAKDLQEKVGMKHALEAGTEIHHKAGKNVVIEAGVSITLKAGGGFITIGPAGVTISGVPVLINSGGVAGSGSGCSPDVVKLPMEADDGKPGKIGVGSKKVEPGQKKEEILPVKINKTSAKPVAKPKNILTHRQRATEKRKQRYQGRKQMAANAGSTPTQQAAAERLIDNNDNIIRAEAANYVYRVDEFNRGHIDELPEAPVGLNLLDQKQMRGLENATFTDKVTGFGAALFKSDISGETLLTYRGTNNGVTGKQDWKTNALQGVGRETEQYNQAMRLAKTVKKSQGKNFVTVGHSLGGGLASAGTAMTGVKGYTYNSAGLHPKTATRVGGMKNEEAAQLIQIRAVEGEVLTGAQRHGNKVLSGLGVGSGALAGGPVGAGAGYLLSKTLSDVPQAVGEMKPLPSVKGGNPVVRHGMDQVIEGIEAQKKDDIQMLTSTQAK